RSREGARPATPPPVAPARRSRPCACPPAHAGRGGVEVVGDATSVGVGQGACARGERGLPVPCPRRLRVVALGGPAPAHRLGGARQVPPAGAGGAGRGARPRDGGAARRAGAPHRVLDGRAVEMSTRVIIATRGLLTRFSGSAWGRILAPASS